MANDTIKNRRQAARTINRLVEFDGSTADYILKSAVLYLSAHGKYLDARKDYGSSVELVWEDSGVEPSTIQIDELASADLIEALSQSSLGPGEVASIRAEAADSKEEADALIREVLYQEPSEDADAWSGGFADNH